MCLPRLLVLRAVLAVLFMSSEGAIAESWVKVVQPVAYTSIQPGATMYVSVEASPDITVVAAYLTDIGSMAVADKRPFSIALKVPRNAIGVYSIVASGKSAGGVLVEALPVSIRVGAVSAETGKLMSQFNTIDLEFPGARTGLPFYYSGSQGEVRPIVMSMFSWRSEPTGYVAVADGYVYGLRAGDASLIVTDGLSTLAVPIAIKRGIKGDLNGDGVIDERDLAAFRLQPLNVNAVSSEDARDLNGDGKVDALDLRVLTTLCTRPRCAMQ